METITFSTEIKDRPFDVCINPANFCKNYNVFELRSDGKHFEYIYRNQQTGEYFLGEDSKLSSDDLEIIYQNIESQLQC